MLPHLRRTVGTLISLTVLVALLPSAASAADAGLWRDLRTLDGMVVLYRHAIAPGGGDPAGFRLGDCSTQRNLSSEGRDQARAIGRELRRQRVSIDDVRSSRWCRARDTARLMDVGPVRDTPALDSVFTAPATRAARQERQTRRIIRDHRGDPGVLLLVGHQANIIDLTGIAPASGEGIVVRADRRGDIRVVGRIPAP